MPHHSAFAEILRSQGLQPPGLTRPDNWYRSVHYTEKAVLSFSLTASEIQYPCGFGLR